MHLSCSALGLEWFSINFCKELIKVLLKIMNFGLLITVILVNFLPHGPHFIHIRSKLEWTNVLSLLEVLLDPMEIDKLALEI
jgi:hypothetical protein